MVAISTHTSHAGRDFQIPGFALTAASFLLTRPMRDVTITNVLVEWLGKISTHTSHAGRDQDIQGTCQAVIYFYSHVPCGT